MQVTLKKAKEAKNSVKYRKGRSFAYLTVEELTRTFGFVPQEVTVTLEEKPA